LPCDEDDGVKTHGTLGHSEDCKGFANYFRPCEQFAAKIGVTSSAVNSWENGKGKPSPLAMKQIEELQNELEF